MGFLDSLSTIVIFGWMWASEVFAKPLFILALIMGPAMAGVLVAVLVGNLVRSSRMIALLSATVVPALIILFQTGWLTSQNPQLTGILVLGGAAIVFLAMLVSGLISHFIASSILKRPNSIYYLLPISAVGLIAFLGPNYIAAGKSKSEGRIANQVETGYVSLTFQGIMIVDHGVQGNISDLRVLDDSTVLLTLESGGRLAFTREPKSETVLGQPILQRPWIPTTVPDPLPEIQNPNFLPNEKLYFPHDIGEQVIAKKVYHFPMFAFLDVELKRDPGSHTLLYFKRDASGYKLQGMGVSIVPQRPDGQYKLSETVLGKPLTTSCFHFDAIETLAVYGDCKQVYAFTP